MGRDCQRKENSQGQNRGSNTSKHLKAIQLLLHAWKWIAITTFNVCNITFHNAFCISFISILYQFFVHQFETFYSVVHLHLNVAVYSILLLSRSHFLHKDNIYVLWKKKRIRWEIYTHISSAAYHHVTVVPTES